MPFPIILSGGYLRDTLHISTYEHYSNECYLYDADTQAKLLSLEKFDMYLTIRLNPKALVHSISFKNVFSSDAHSIFCYFN